MNTLNRRKFLSSSALLATSSLITVTANAAAKDPMLAKWDEEADIIVVGSGFAGLAAAAEAKNANAGNVIVLEKMRAPGGNSVINGGIFAVPGNPAQVKLGIKDSPELLASDMIAAGLGYGYPEKIKAMTEEALPTYEWTVKELGVQYNDKVGQEGGHSVPRHVFTNNVTTGPGGGIAVGPNVWTDKDTHVQIGNGDLYFAKDSLTVIDSSILTDGKSAFNTTSDIAKVTVEPGANLVLGNIEEVGDYTIVNGYITGGNEANGMWTGGWRGNNLYALPQDGSGINWILTLHNDPSKIWVNATLADVRTVYPDIAIPNIANDDMLNCKSGDPGADFVCRVLRDKELNVAGKTKILNSVANIAFAGGAMSVAMNDLNSATDSIEGRVSMKNEAFTEYGVMRECERGNDLWIDVIGGKQKYKSLSATGISKAGYDTNSYGFVMGYDRKFADKPIILGAAFSYNHGSLGSIGDVLKTKNKYDSFGLHAYGAYAPVEKVNLIGTLSWMHNSSDITQSINAAGFNKADADVKTNMFSLGARAEATIPAGTANIVPHAGLRYVWAKSGKYDTKVDGKKVWSNKADATNTFQLPIGVAVRTDIATASGWNVRPQADVTVIPQFGDTKQKTKLSNFNGVSDKLSGEFAGKFGTNVNLGVQADKGPATIGVRYGFTGGTKGKADHMFKLEARYRF